MNDISMSDNADILRSEDLKALVESTRHLASELELAELLRQILVKAGQLTDSPDGSVILYDEARGGLYFAAATGEQAAAVLARFGEHGQELVPLESKAGIVFTKRRSLRTARLADDPEHFRGVDQETQHTTQSMLCVPLVIGGMPIGVMQMLNKRSGEYSERDERLFEEFAYQAAVAIRNAQLFQDVLAHMGLYSTQPGAMLELAKRLRQPARVERLTLLFADMRGFTELSHKLRAPEKVQEILNEFLTVTAEEILKLGGVVNKFIGDGVFAFFRGPAAAELAVRCAFAMVRSIGERCQRWDENHNEDLGFLGIGVGIVTDDVIVGTIGNAKVKDFTAIGAAVNLAAAYEQAARGKDRHVLIDQHTYNEARGIIAETDGPTNYELKKPDQKGGHFYKQYQVKRLIDPLPAITSEPAVVAPPVALGPVIVPTVASSRASSRSAAEDPRPPVDFVIVTALEEERDAVLRKLRDNRILPPSDTGVRNYYWSLLPFAYADGTKGTYRTIVMPLLDMGRLDAAMATIESIQRWRPRYVLLVGIAGGFAGRGIQVGDVMVADQVVDYEIQKLKRKGPDVRYRVHPADPKLIGGAKNLAADVWRRHIGVQRPGTGVPSRHVGAIASGDKVDAVGSVIETYGPQWSELIGVEMEAAGVASACFKAAQPPGFFMVRGVSDLADSDKDSDEVNIWRPYACEVAAAYAIALLETGPVTPIIET